MSDQQFGAVKWFNETKGYGFIVPDNGSKDVFVHKFDLEKSGLNGIAEGVRVSFETKENKGRVSACNIKIVDGN